MEAERVDFESDEYFTRLTKETEIYFVGYFDRPLAENQKLLKKLCRELKDINIVFLAYDFELDLFFNSFLNEKQCDFDKEDGKVHITTRLRMIDVHVIFHGWLDLNTLYGFGYIEFDEESALRKEAMVQQFVAEGEERMSEFIKQEAGLGYYYPEDPNFFSEYH